MKKWLVILLGSFGAFYTAIKDLVIWLQKEYPMSIDQWAFRIIIILSICYGIFQIGKFLYDLNMRLASLEKEPANRVEAITQLSKRINDLAQDCYRVVKKQTEVVKQEESSTRKLDDKIRDKLREKIE